MIGSNMTLSFTSHSSDRRSSGNLSIDSIQSSLDKGSNTQTRVSPRVQSRQKRLLLGGVAQLCFIILLVIGAHAASDKPEESRIETIIKDLNKIDDPKMFDMKTADEYVEMLKEYKNDKEQSLRVFKKAFFEEYLTKHEKLIDKLAAKEIIAKNALMKIKSLKAPDAKIRECIYECQKYLNRAAIIKERVARTRAMESGACEKAYTNAELLDIPAEWRTGDGTDMPRENGQHRTLRVVQKNALAHGLSDESCGFSQIYKKGCECFDFKAELLKLEKMPANFFSVMAKNGVEESLAIEKIGKLVDRDLKNGYEAKIKANYEEMDESYRTAGLSAQHAIDISKIFNKWSLKNTLPREELMMYMSNADKARMQGDNGGYKLKDNAVPFGVCYRMGRVLIELLETDADIMTVVELDCFDYYAKILKHFGYEGKFQEKAGSDKKGKSKKDTPGHKYYQNRDGVAIFWKTELFTPVEFECPNEERSKRVFTCDSFPKKELVLREDEKIMHNIFLGSKHGAQVAADITFQVNGTKKKFAIVTGHLKSGKFSSDIKVKNGIVKFVADRIGYLYKKNIPAIFSGDFNSPFDSPTFAFFQEELAKHGCPMRSAYGKDYGTKIGKRKGGAQAGKVGPIINHAEDFIMFTSQIGCSRLLFMAGDKDFSEKIDDAHGGFPNLNSPSDHIIIGAELDLFMEDWQFRYKKNQRVEFQTGYTPLKCSFDENLDLIPNTKKETKDLMWRCGNVSKIVTKNNKLTLKVKCDNAEYTVIHRDSIRYKRRLNCDLRRGLWRTQKWDHYVADMKAYYVNRNTGKFDIFQHQVTGTTKIRVKMGIETSRKGFTPGSAIEFEEIQRLPINIEGCNTYQVTSKFKKKFNLVTSADLKEKINASTKSRRKKSRDLRRTQQTRV